MLRAAFGRELDGRRAELRRRSPEPVKPEPCMKAAKPMPRLMGEVGLVAVELGALGVVVGFVEGAGEQALHVDGVGEELAGGGAHRRWRGSCGGGTLRA